MLDDIKKTLWATADKLRANMDAAEYKHLVLGLIFIKYISDRCTNTSSACSPAPTASGAGSSHARQHRQDPGGRAGPAPRQGVRPVLRLGRHVRAKREVQLQAHQAEIDAALGVKLEWMELPDGHACRILQVRPDSPLESEDQWPAYYAWLEQAALRMSEVFRPLVKGLS